jgi:hypothetical protein
MSDISIAELERRARRGEEWSPALESGPLTLRLGLGFGTESWQWVAAERPGGGASARFIALKSQVFMQAMGGPVNEAELVRGGLIRIREQSIAASVVRDLVKSAAFSITPLPLPAMIMDGLMKWVSVDHGDTTTTFSWPASGPREWRPLVDWAKAARHKLHALVCPDEPLDEPAD